MFQVQLKLNLLHEGSPLPQGELGATGTSPPHSHNALHVSLYLFS